MQVQSSAPSSRAMPSRAQPTCEALLHEMDACMLSVRAAATCSCSSPKPTAGSCGRATAPATWRTGCGCATASPTGRRRRWIGASHALESLPSTAEAFSGGPARHGQGGGALPVRDSRDASRDLLPWAERVRRAPSAEGQRAREREVRPRRPDAGVGPELRWWHFHEGRHCCSRDACRPRRAGWWSAPSSASMRQVPVMPGGRGADPRAAPGRCAGGVCSAVALRSRPRPCHGGRARAGARSLMGAGAGQRRGEPGCALEGGGVASLRHGTAPGL